MGCKYMDQCPYVDRQCRANIADYKKMEYKCIPFLVTAYENVKKELQEYKDAGLTTGQIRELKKLYKIIPDGYTLGDIHIMQQLAEAGE